MAVIHELKINPEYFVEVKDGRKKAELRKADREFLRGDYLLLREWNGYRFDRQLPVKVTHILPVRDFIPGGDDWVIMSFRMVTLDDISEIISAKVNDAGESL
ncbi:DUF3850 domain-containing protein [Rosenbergiella nectarea]|uniref:DUF3850 domain-containing protein n=1 Tax=Rosenbergiella nectarea TaxID=988801 RepID=UPI001F4D91C2|nr:DUF3850 domain-containing protein [Rosenbergiella nectarea]